MKKCVWFFIICLLPAVPAFLSAQTAAEIEGLLGTEAVSYGQAARFVLKAADISELQEPAAAFGFAAGQQWLPRNADAEGIASLQGISLLVMRSFDLKGGVLYSLFKNPHYAYREMVYQDIIQGRADPDMTVSGSDLLFLVSQVLSRREEAAPQESQSVPAARRLADQQALADQITAQLKANSIANTSVRITDEGVTISLSNIQFLPNSVELPDSEKSKLQEIARILEAIPGPNILVTGHTALAGTPADRLQTSYDRARSVAAYLVSLGTRTADTIYALGYGAEKPVADNNTPEGMALNRRVEITILENRQ
ncbi:MAG: OmpA family protein [Treponema sp.]|nr:OmpA family protein [Treponema sp.]